MRVLVSRWLSPFLSELACENHRNHWDGVRNSRERASVCARERDVTINKDYIRERRVARIKLYALPGVSNGQLYSLARNSDRT